MPDEYDQIERDMRPFYALQPRDLRERIEMHSNDKDTYTIKVTNGKITTTAQYKDEGIHHARLKSQLDLIKDVAQWIPDMKAIYTVHDTPMSLINWDHRVEIADRLEEDECECGACVLRHAKPPDGQGLWRHRRLRTN